jgi:uncharacterized protein with HEPN domain
LSEHDERLRLLHMRDAAQKIVQFCAGRTRSDLDADEMLSLAVARLLEILGEAATYISKETRERAPDIPWSLIVGTRNRLIHAYPSVNHDIVWSIATEQLESLICSLEALLSERP